ncbi:hypothetical protein FBU31_002608 [Coemansia sp. 'formosensis']|nr:hypothetical protein FBU31_002608 [Coemansia sp. 'formosensis']
MVGVELLDLEDMMTLLGSKEAKFSGVVHVTDGSISICATSQFEDSTHNIPGGIALADKLTAEYEHVFRDPLVGLPPARDMDHQIELQLGMQPVARTPY